MSNATDQTDMEYTFQPPPHAPAGQTITGAQLRTFDLRTAPDRLSAYCDALDGRVDALEKSNAVLHEAVNKLQEAITVLLDREIARMEVRE